MTQPADPDSRPRFFDVLSTRAARLPWWAIIVGIGLALIFYSFATSNLYRRVLRFVTDDPRVSTPGYPRVGFDVTEDGRTTTVRGVLISESGDSYVVETQAEARVSIPATDLGSVTCPQPNPDGSCPIGSTVTAVRAKASGALIQEETGRFQIQSDFGETLSVFKIGVADVVRIPEGCRPNPEGACRVELTLSPDVRENQITGVLIESGDALVIQTKPSAQRTFPKSAVTNVQYRRPDPQCALNNLVGCDQGPFLTLYITLASFVIAVILGLAFGLMRLSSNPALYTVATIYVEVIRGVPLILILLFVSAVFAPWFRDNFPPAIPAVQLVLIVLGILIAVYVALRARRAGSTPREIIPQVAIVVVAVGLLIAWVGSLNDQPLSELVPRAILGLSIGYGAFLTELFRAGIQSISAGQMEAARSLGMNYVQAMRYVVLPQAFRVVLPPLGNDFIAMLKDSSLAAVIGVAELTQMARLFGAASYRVFEAYITIGALYLCMTLFLSFVVRTIEKRISIQSR